VSTLNAHESAVSGLAVVSPGLVCSGARDAFVAFWDLSTSQCLSKEFIGQNTVTSMCMLPSSSPLVVQGAEDLCFRLWDPRDFRVSKVIGKGILQYFPTCVAASRDGNRIAIGTNGFDGSGCLVMTFDVRNSSQPLKIFSGHQHKLTSVQFAPTDLEEFVVSSSKDHTLRIWDTLTGKESFSTSFNDDSATDLSVSRMAATDLPSVCASFFGGGVWDMRWQSKHEEPQLQCTSECLGPSHLSPFSSPVHIS
jgi:WD40 repeat protein